MTNHPPACETLRFERHGHAAWLTLNRPEAMNSMSPQLVQELGQALDHIEADRDVRCVVITGEGRAFCAGADLKAVKSFGGQAGPAGQEAAIRIFLGMATALLRRIERIMVEAHNHSHDRREGLTAFAERRTPDFNGT